MGTIETLTNRRARAIDQVAAARNLVWADQVPGVRAHYCRLSSALRISGRAIDEGDHRLAELYLDSAEATITLLYALHAISREDQG